MLPVASGCKALCFGERDGIYLIDGLDISNKKYYFIRISLGLPWFSEFSSNIFVLLVIEACFIIYFVQVYGRCMHENCFLKKDIRDIQCEFKMYMNFTKRIQLSF